MAYYLLVVFTVQSEHSACAVMIVVPKTETVVHVRLLQVRLEIFLSHGREAFGCFRYIV